MATVSVSLPADGSTGQVSQYNTPFTSLLNEFNGNIDNNNVKTGAAIDPAKLAGGSATMLSAGIAYTPTWTNLTVGNGTNASTYIQIGKMVYYRVKFTFGSTSSVTGGLQFSLPVTSISYGSSYSATIGSLAVRDDSAPTNLPGFVWWVSTTTAEPNVMNAAGTYMAGAGLAAGTPYTWATGDVIQAVGMYEAP